MVTGKYGYKVSGWRLIVRAFRAIPNFRIPELQKPPEANEHLNPEPGTSNNRGH